MNTNDLVTHSRARFDLQTKKRLLREKYEAKMLFAYNGGMWRAGPELQTILLTCPGNEAVILDLYETPVRINVPELFARAHECWQEQMNAWLLEWQEQNQRR